MVHLIVAMTPKGVIGKDGTLPWHIPEDLKHFKRLTSGSQVVMGRKTFDSLNMPKGLPNRQNFVVSRNAPKVRGYDPEVTYRTSVEDALLSASLCSQSPNTFIIGGATIYEHALKNNLVDEMHISFVKEQYDGDTNFPDFDKTQWEEIEHVDMGDFIYIKFKFLGETNKDYMNLKKLVDNP